MTWYELIELRGSSLINGILQFCVCGFIDGASKILVFVRACTVYHCSELQEMPVQHKITRIYYWPIARRFFLISLILIRSKKFRYYKISLISPKNLLHKDECLSVSKLQYCSNRNHILLRFLIWPCGGRTPLRWTF